MRNLSNTQAKLAPTEEYQRRACKNCDRGYNKLTAINSDTQRQESPVQNRFGIMTAASKSQRKGGTVNLKYFCMLSGDSLRLLRFHKTRIAVADELLLTTVLHQDIAKLQALPATEPYGRNCSSQGRVAPRPFNSSSFFAFLTYHKFQFMNFCRSCLSYDSFVQRLSLYPPCSMVQWHKNRSLDMVSRCHSSNLPPRTKARVFYCVHLNHWPP